MPLLLVPKIVPGIAGAPEIFVEKLTLEFNGFERQR